MQVVVAFRWTSLNVQSRESTAKATLQAKPAPFGFASQSKKSTNSSLLRKVLSQMNVPAVHGGILDAWISLQARNRISFMYLHICPYIEHF